MRPKLGVFQQNKIWARHTDEKPDVAASLMYNPAPAPDVSTGP